MKEQKNGRIVKISKQAVFKTKGDFTINSTGDITISTLGQVQIESGNTIYSDFEPFTRQRSGSTWVHLGVFFDGTGNNKYNIDLRRKNKITIPANNSSYDSYRANFSNVARLWNLYKTEKKEYDSSSGIKSITYHVRTYVEGIGTKKGKPDDSIGSGTGRMDRGVIGKVEEGIKQIIEDFKSIKVPIKTKLINGIEVAQIDKLVIDIFGFSRGAAAARHFANVISDQEEFVCGALSEALEKAGYPLEQGSVEIRFIGLFDTVAAVTSNAEVAPVVTGAINGFTIGGAVGATVGAGSGIAGVTKAAQNCDNGKLRLHLGKIKAKRIIHLTAEDEYRANFQLNLGGIRVRIPGVHSDIGGGYEERRSETDFKLSLSVKTKDSQPPQELEQLREAFLKSLFYTEKQIWIDTQIKIRSYPQGGNMEGIMIEKKEYTHTLMGNRGVISDRYSLIPMEIMKKHALQAGVEWMTPQEAAVKDEEQTLAESDYTFAHNDLISAKGVAFLEKIKGFYLKHYFGQPQNYESGDIQIIKNKVLHISSEYNTPMLMGLVYPNQPSNSGTRGGCPDVASAYELQLEQDKIKRKEKRIQSEKLEKRKLEERDTPWGIGPKY